MSDDADFDAADNGAEDSFNRADDGEYDDYQDEDAAEFDNDHRTDEYKHNPIHTSTSFSSSPSPLPASDSQNYECLDSTQLRAHMDALIADVAAVIDQPKAKAALLLRTQQWNKERLIARYFEQPQQLLVRVGMQHYDEADGESEASMSDESGGVSCPICDDEYSLRDTYSLGDGHRFCSSCWHDYLTSALANGRAVVLTRCPAYQCNTLVHDETFRRLCTEAEYDRLLHFVLRSYVEDNRSMRWCTHPGCQYALHALNHAVLSVSCRAGHKFCFQCQEEWHEPCTCEQLVKWREKNTTESDNAHWIIANTKRCPQCSVRIEKNQGCNHITCRHCKYEWCWVCNGDWKEHGNHTGGFYKCNKWSLPYTHTDTRTRTRTQTRTNIKHFTRLVYVHLGSARGTATPLLPLSIHSSPTWNSHTTREESRPGQMQTASHLVLCCVCYLLCSVLQESQRD